MREVAHDHPSGSGALSRLVDAVALASLAPNGGQRGTLDKGGTRRTRLRNGRTWRRCARRLCSGLAKPFEPGPEFVSWGAFTMDA